MRKRGAKPTKEIHDYAVLIGTPDGTVRAALAVAMLTRRGEAPHDDLLSSLLQCARDITHAAGLGRVD